VVGSTATPHGFWPTGTVAVTVRVEPSITDTPSSLYQVPTQDGPVLPGNQILPPVCAHAMQACGFDYDPATGTWRPRGGG
jgi:hypothetical protein